MAWYGWVSLGVGVTGWLVCLRPVARFMELEDDMADDACFMYFGLFLCSLFALAWPVYVVAISFHKAFGGGLQAWILAEPRTVRRERAIREREQRIDRMERELGIGPYRDKAAA